MSQGGKFKHPDQNAASNEEPENITKQSEAERVKSDSSEEQRNETISDTKFIDINYDCLELIFKRLSLKDMLNLVDTCTTLKNAATLHLETSFNRRHGYYHVDIKNIRFNSKLVIQYDQGYFKINDFKDSLQFLRCFGHRDVSVNIDYDAKYENQYTRIYDYLNEYCSDTLGAIFIRSASKFAMKYTDKPFSKVIY